MAPIPRCDLRLPSEPLGRRRSFQTTPSPRPPESAAEDNDVITVESKLEDSSADTGHGRGQLHAGRSKTRDSAEILEGAAEFSTGVTRDMVEIREHRQHEGATGLEDDGLGGSGGRPQALDPCTVLEQCRAEIEAEAAAAAAAEAAAAAIVSDDDDSTSAPVEVSPAAAAAPTAAPAAQVAATPGDTDAQFCADRPESPYSDYHLRTAMASTATTTTKKVAATACKGTYSSLETYASLWGSSKAVTARKKLELEMKKKRKFYERLHARNQRRREREKRRAKEKRRMMRCRDQSKIPQTIDDIGVNKAFHLRFNYNKRLPFMPSTMNQHLKKYKKPPFRHFHKGSRACRKHVDEFEKLRVTEADAAGRNAVAAKSATPAAAGAATAAKQPPPKAKARVKAKA